MVVSIAIANNNAAPWNSLYSVDQSDAEAASKLVDVSQDFMPYEGAAVPDSILQRYADSVMHYVVVLPTEAGNFIAQIQKDGFEDVWACADTEANAKADLRETLLGWLELKIEDEDKDIPVIDPVLNLNRL